MPESTEELHVIKDAGKGTEVLERTDQFKYVHSFPNQEFST